MSKEDDTKKDYQDAEGEKGSIFIERKKLLREIITDFNKEMRMIESSADEISRGGSKKFPPFSAVAEHYLELVNKVAEIEAELAQLEILSKGELIDVGRAQLNRLIKEIEALEAAKVRWVDMLNSAGEDDNRIMLQNVIDQIEDETKRKYKEVSKLMEGIKSGESEDFHPMAES